MFLVTAHEIQNGGVGRNGTPHLGRSGTVSHTSLDGVPYLLLVSLLRIYCTIRSFSWVLDKNASQVAEKGSNKGTSPK
mgnify:CR=1 FL=1